MAQQKPKNNLGYASKYILKLGFGSKNNNTKSKQ